MLPIRVHFLMERVVDSDLGTSQLVDAVHVRLEHWSVVIVVLDWAGHKHECVDHLVLQEAKQEHQHAFASKCHC